MLAWVAVSVLSGCDEASSQRFLDGVDSEAVGLLDLTRMGPVRLSPDGPVVVDGQGEPLGHSSLTGVVFGDRDAVLTLPVLDDGERPAVRWQDTWFELQLYVDREDAVTWSLGPTQGGLADGSAAVSFETGVALELLDESDRGALVRYSERDFWLDAWVPTYDVDQVRTAPMVSTESNASYANSAWILPNTDLFDGPGGPWMGRFEPARPNTSSAFDPSPISQERLGDAVDGYVPVAWTAPGVRAEVWVKEVRVVDEPSGLYGFGGGFSAGSSCGLSAPPLVILADSPLHDGVEGQLVGRSLVDVAIWTGEAELTSTDGWLRYHVASPWGPVPVWLESSSVGHSDSAWDVGVEFSR